MAWVYGADQFMEDLKFMLGFYPFPYVFWKWGWKLVSPIIVVVSQQWRWTYPLDVGTINVNLRVSCCSRPWTTPGTSTAAITTQTGPTSSAGWSPSPPSSWSPWWPWSRSPGRRARWLRGWRSCWSPARSGVPRGQTTGSSTRPRATTASLKWRSGRTLRAPTRLSWPTPRRTISMLPVRYVVERN